VIAETLYIIQEYIIRSLKRSMPKVMYSFLFITYWFIILPGIYFKTNLIGWRGSVGYRGCPVVALSLLFLLLSNQLIIMITKEKTVFGTPTTMSDRDWIEDFKYENGNYHNTCCHCKERFMGYKRRVICKVCVENLDVKAVAQRKVKTINNSGDIVHRSFKLLESKSKSIMTAVVVSIRICTKQPAVYTMDQWTHIRSIGNRHVFEKHLSLQINTINSLYEFIAHLVNK